MPVAHPLAGKRERRERPAGRPPSRAGGQIMLVTTADLVVEFFRRRAKIMILTFFTYAALC
jgi:hypothetical protein